LFKVEIEKYFNLKNIIIWVKDNGTAGDVYHAYGRQYEFIMYANKGLRKINGKRLTDVWEFNRAYNSKLLHQNEKPFNLMKRIIEKSSNRNDIIYDPFVGSGVSLMAAKYLCRRYFGNEIDKYYYNIAEKRLLNFKESQKIIF
jgi:site-specific DNA-methyltransferase (adenine-specific)